MNQNQSLRLSFIDNLRILLTFLVIMHHTMITYSGGGDWYFHDPNTQKISSLIFTILCGLNQGFFMALFFFISAYFVPGSYRRKKTWSFLKDRFIRLGIPIVIYALVIHPTMIYFIISDKQNTFLEYYLLYIYKGAVLNGTGPLWFTVALLIFSLCYCAWQGISNDPTTEIEKKTPSKRLYIFSIFLIGVAAFLIRLWSPMGRSLIILNIQICFVAQYIVIFILGLYAAKHDWFLSIPDAQGKRWLTIAFVSVFFCFAVFILSGGLEGDPIPLLGGFHWQSFAFSLWEGVYGMGMCVGLVVLFRMRLNTQSKWAKALSDNSYTMYIIHPPVLVVVSFLVVDIAISAAIKFAIVLPVVLILCFVISHFILRQIPGARRVLG